jgi:acyl-coenzyme A thioesterase PaaI-like protein
MDAPMSGVRLEQWMLKSPWFAWSNGCSNPPGSPGAMDAPAPLLRVDERAPLRGDGPMKLGVDNRCFACGSENPIGLKLEFRFEGDDYLTSLEVRPEYQGWTGVMHGGLMATALDEVMARLLWEKDVNAITGRLNIRYHQAVPIGERLEIRGRITKHRPPAIETTAEARTADGTLVAEARAVSMEV